MRSSCGRTPTLPKTRQGATRSRMPPRLVRNPRCERLRRIPPSPASARVAPAGWPAPRRSPGLKGARESEPPTENRACRRARRADPEYRPGRAARSFPPGKQVRRCGPGAARSRHSPRGYCRCGAGPAETTQRASRFVPAMQTAWRTESIGLRLPVMAELASRRRR